MKLIKFEQGKNWWQGKLSVNYNLKWLLLPLLPLLPLLLLALLFIYVWRGLVWVAEHIWKGVSWISVKIWEGIVWIGSGLLLVWVFMLGWFRSSKTAGMTNTTKKCLWFIPLLILLLCLFGIKCCTKCGTMEENKQVSSVEEVVEEAWDDVLVARIYLDYKNPDNVGGLKYIQGLPVKQEVSLEELANVVEYDWRKLVKDNVTHSLTKQQATVTTLLAMRMGASGFKKSPFLQLINQGNFDMAGRYIKLVDARGNARTLGTEAKQYLRILRLMWENKLTVSQLEEYPHHSYKAIPLQVSDYECLKRLSDNRAGTERVCDIIGKLN